MVRTRKANDEAVLPMKCDGCSLIHTPGAQCPTTTQAEEDQERKVSEKNNEPIPAATTGARGRYLADFLTVGYKYCRSFTFNSGLGGQIH